MKGGCVDGVGRRVKHTTYYKWSESSDKVNENVENWGSKLLNKRSIECHCWLVH